MTSPLTHDAIMLFLQDVGFTVHEDYAGSLFDGDDETLHLWDEDGQICDAAFIAFARAIEAALHDALRQPKHEPVGWAVFQGDELLFIHKDHAHAHAWLTRGVEGRTIQPVFL